jgi:hypothetical protein
MKEDRAMMPALALLLFVLPPLPGHADSLLPPFPVLVNGKALDIEHDGHAAPFAGDFYEDGGLCLLVGQYESGRMRIYRNTGTRTKPRFNDFTWFTAGGQIASVPVG